MTLLNSLLDALYALSITDPALVAGGFFAALVLVHALILAACITLKVTR
jgi:hypothetical protein